MANAPHNNAGGKPVRPANGRSGFSTGPVHRRRKKRGTPPFLPLLILLAVLAGLIAVGAAACGARGESFQQLESGSVENSSEPQSAATASQSGGEEKEATSSESPLSSSSVASVSSELESEPIDAAEDWRLVLVNSSNRLDGDYDVELANVNESYQLDARIVEDMKEMLAAAKADGYTLQICSAYRSTERSRVLYSNQINKFKAAGYSDEDAAVEAAKWVAPPGTSEHNTGLSADIVSGDYFTKYAELEHDFEKFDEFKWLYANCAKYGFVLRYPKDKQEITGITYEPWHYRYVGKENAQRIMDEGLCLEEFLKN